ncbi:hypothetical protein ACIP5Y_25935 [Nocardia sp. NPDC088792]|uniref:hypothetical protein n=1 Tax=Nocardia sp. NPDC088792 TaxID=3364332 RepID=UPI0037FB7159
MGLDYSYEVYVHRDSARGLLETLKANCPARPDRTTTVEFPDGQVVMPFTSHFASGTTVRFDPATLQRGSLLDLDLSISFEADDELLEWVDRDLALRIDADGRRLCDVGYIYLHVWQASTFLPDHLCFDFMAATTRMSRLFARSASIRKWFVDLTFDHGGPLCLLDLEEKGRITITLGSTDCQYNVDWAGLYI